MKESAEYHRAHHLFEEVQSDEDFQEWQDTVAWEWINENLEQVIDYFLTVNREQVVKVIAETLREQDLFPIENLFDDKMKVIYDDLWVPQNEEP